MVYFESINKGIKVISDGSRRVLLPISLGTLTKYEPPLSTTKPALVRDVFQSTKKSNLVLSLENKMKILGYSSSEDMANPILRYNVNKYFEVLERLKSTEIERFHFGKSVLPEVIALEEKMQSMGVKVTFEDNLELAKLITTSIEKVKAKGLRVPERIILMTPAKDKFVSGICEQENNLILLNNNLIAYKKAEQTIFGMDKGFSNLTAENTVFHEIGHLLHPKNIPNTDKIWKTMANGGDVYFIHNGVSYYATKNPREFVAEVFAGLMCGKQFSKQVMAIYNALKGPQVL